MRFILPALLRFASALHAQTWNDFETPPHNYWKIPPQDPATVLQQRMQQKEVTLAADSDPRTFLRAYLNALQVPVSSQVLVFSRSSLQRTFVNGHNPRAMYFNEDTYVGWMPGGLIEVTGIDPVLGGIFYIFDIPRGERPLSFERSDRCMNCHAGEDTGYVPGLLVKGRQSSFAFKGRNVPEDEIARTLGVGYIVNGTVQRSGSQVRILARLNRAADGNQIWSEGFTEEAKDIFSVQDRIAGLIAQNLQLKLGAAAKPKRAVNPEAHRLTLEGRHFWTLRTDEGFQRAESAYLKALEIDPDFAEAHAGLADVWAVRGWYDVLAGIDVTSHFARAREQAQLALRIDDTLAGPWAALGAVNYNEWMFVEAERAFQNALRLNPNYSYAHHWRAHLLMVQGRLDEALRELDTATRLDPLSLATLVIYASQLQYAGRYAEALEMCDRAAAFTPYVFVPLQATRAYGLLMLGRRNEALTTARLAARDITVKPRWWNDALVVFVLRACGQSAEAEELTNRLLSGMDANNRGRATLLAAAGRTEEALAEFARLKPGASAMGVVYYSEICESLRKHPRFLDTLAKLDSLADYHVAQATLARMKGARK